MSRIIHKDLVFDSLIECKKRMDEYRFLSTYFSMHYNLWSNMRVFLIEKNFIKNRHNTYVWIGEEPNEELALEFIKYYKALKKKGKTITPKETKSNGDTTTTMYEDLVALQKKVQKLKEENREMFKELKENYSQKVKVQKAYDELSEKIRSVLYSPEKDSVLYNFFKKSVEEYINKKG